MNRLFWKIFLWFWTAMLLMGLSIAWGIATLIDNSDLDSRHSQHKRMLRARVVTLAQVMEYNGELAARRFLRRSQRRALGLDPIGRPLETDRPGLTKRPHPDLQIYVVNSDGLDLLQRPLPDWVGEHTSQNTSNDNTALQLPQSALIAEEDQTYTMTSSVVSVDGPSYTIIARLVMPEKPSVNLQKVVPFGLGRIYERHPEVMEFRIGMALLLSSLFCLALSWYLVKPMKLLRTASRKIAEGQLQTRVAEQIGSRGDELESLGLDFDYMAERIQTLVTTQQNLLNDVSHELRSPLARIQVAVGLAQQKNGNNIVEELDRLELETTRLNDLLEQVLTLARLDSGAINQQHDYVDLVALLEDIAADAEFEAIASNKRVSVQHGSRCTVQANLGLLHRALENIVRNAIKYTAEQTTVTIRLGISGISSQRVQIQICDSGDGVPETLLNRLFEPFFRVASARDRSSGGYGLGLAIAKRAINAHQGTIKAQNRLDGGLCVSIELPYINPTTSSDI